MVGLVFEEKSSALRTSPSRTDVACFVGFVARREVMPDQPTRMSTAIQQWLRDQGWIDSPFERSEAMGERPTLQDVPIPIESWDVFEQLFEHANRPLASTGEASMDTYLGAAVRSFFAQGGRKCYVVRVGDPIPFSAAETERRSLLGQLLPGYPQGLIGSPRDPASWHGVGHLWGLSEVAYVCLPDLADTVATPTPTPNNEEVNPTADIDNGRLICLVGVALLKPAEFVIFRIGQAVLSGN